jgi:uncharacterized protein
LNNSIKVTKSIPMEMRDGTLLRADIYRPDDNQKHPVLLTRTPYERKSVAGYSFLPIVDTVLAGYAIAVQSIRGLYDSGGVQNLGDATFSIDGPDGYDSVEWLASQSWCDGNVCMAGGSFMGSTQFITARENPPHLKAISPWVAGAGVAEPTRRNGIVHLAAGLNWIIGIATAIINREEKEGKDVSAKRRLLNRAASNPEEIYNFLPLKDVPHFNFEGIRDIWTSRMLDTSRDIPEYAAKTQLAYDKINVPCYLVSGWFDTYPSGNFDHFLGMRERGGSQRARQSQHLLMGPWDHMGPNSIGDTGDLGFGPSANIVGSQLAEHIISFFNKYVMGMTIDLPAVRYFVMGKNVWRNADTWPLPETQWQRFFLHSKGRANTSGGDGWLSRDEPGPETADTFIYNPLFPVITTGCQGHSRVLRFAPAPQEQSPVERRDDVLCYTTPELKEDLEVTGPLELHLFASTSARDTDFTAKIVDVYPDGYAFNVVCDGVIRARYRKSLFQPELVNPGEVNEYVIKLEAISQLFRKGHRIRIDVSSSSFPEFDRNMNTGNSPGEDAQGIVAEQHIFHEAKYPSYIDLPVNMVSA